MTYLQSAISLINHSVVHKVDAELNPMHCEAVIAEIMKPCEHPYFDVKTFIDNQGYVVKCTKCDMVLDRGSK